jgi:hypothetical protein
MAEQAFGWSSALKQAFHDATVWEIGRTGRQIKMNTAEIGVANNKTHILKMQNSPVMSPISPVQPEVNLSGYHRTNSPSP